MSGHTPGEWSYMQDGSEPYWGIGMAGKNPNLGHAMVYTKEEDARLIAAAPELLAALKACADRLGDMDCGDELDLARSAINKAEGRVE